MAVRGLLLWSLILLPASCAWLPPAQAPEAADPPVAPSGPVADPVDVAAPARYRLPADYAPVDEVLLGWDGSWSYLDFYVTLAATIAEEVPVRLVGHPKDTDPFADLLRAEGVPVERILRHDAPIDTMWIRDYGPLFVEGLGDLALVDLPYHDDRPGDDAVPAGLSVAQRRPHLPLDLPMEGAHLLADGEGRCVASDDVLMRALEQGWDEGGLRQRLAEVLGCDDVTFVPPLWGEETGHVDTFLVVTGPGEVLVGTYRESQEPVNAGLLDDGAARLLDAGWSVERVPMPSSSRGTIFRTYTNVLILDGTVIVPVYARARRDEARALAILADAFPTRRLVLLESDEVMDMGGAIHCATRPVPRPIARASSRLPAAPSVSPGASARRGRPRGAAQGAPGRPRWTTRLSLRAAGSVLLPTTTPAKGAR